jgi:DNA-directed RNA polymerase subunit RPC12/RpoP
MAENELGKGKETTIKCLYCHKFFAVQLQEDHKGQKINCPHCGRQLVTKGTMGFTRELIIKPLLLFGALGALSIAYIIAWAVAWGMPSDLGSLFVLAVSIFFTAFLFFTIKRVLYFHKMHRFIQEKRDEKGPIRRLGGSNREENMKEFELRYDDLMKQVEEFLSAAKEIPEEVKARLKEILVSINSVKEQLKQMPEKPLELESLRELEKEVSEDMISLANMGTSILSPKMWLMTLRSGTCKKFGKIEPEMSWLLMILDESLKDLAKDKTEDSCAGSSKAL